MRQQGPSGHSVVYPVRVPVDKARFRAAASCETFGQQEAQERDQSSNDK